MQKMQSTGTVNYYNSQKGFGFIKRDEDPNGDDLFFHFTSLTGDLAQQTNETRNIEIGTKVSFTEGEGRNGRPAATEVDFAGDMGSDESMEESDEDSEMDMDSEEDMDAEE